MEATMDDTADCDARFRPFPNDTEVACEKPPGAHAVHVGVLRDYAWPGSATTFEWRDDDRRNFYGAWPGACSDPGCVLPSGHRGRHAS
jgi:hypothetical protein